MKFIIVLSLTIFSLPSFAALLSCTYLNHDNAIGNVKAYVEPTKNSIKLVFANQTVSSSKCKITVTSSEMNAECDEEGNGIGILFEKIDGKYQGVLISEKAQIFAQTEC